MLCDWDTCVVFENIPEHQRVFSSVFIVTRIIYIVRLVGQCLPVILLEAGIPLPGGLRNKTILENIIYQQKFAIFPMEAFRKMKNFVLLLTSLSGQINQGDPNSSLKTYKRLGDCLSHMLFDTLFFSIRKTYLLNIVVCTCSKRLFCHYIFLKEVKI